MYNFHHDYIKRNFDTNLLFADAGSLVYEIKNEGVYEDFYLNKHLFDLSDFPKDSKFYDPSNEKVVGKMKDKYGDKIIVNIIGLGSKMYWIVAEDGTETKIIKGVNKNLKKNNKEFEDVLFNKKVVRHKIKRIESKLHKIGTHEVSKISSSCFEDKR